MVLFDTNRVHIIRHQFDWSKYADTTSPTTPCPQPIWPPFTIPQGSEAPTMAPTSLHRPTSGKIFGFKPGSSRIIACYSITLLDHRGVVVNRSINCYILMWFPYQLFQL